MPKSKKFYIITGIVVLVIVVLWYSGYKKSHQPIQYDTVKVARGDLSQTVDVTGQIESADDLSLRFEIPGTVGEVKVKEGNKVKTGDLLASLRLSELNAAVAQAQANLNKIIVGATKQDIGYYQAAADGAKASWEQAKVDAAADVSVAQAALDTAENNLQLAEGGENSQIVNSAYNTAVGVLQTTLSVLDDALTQADNILGIDNTMANIDFEIYLSVLDSSRLNIANALYASAKNEKNKARDFISPLTTASNHANTDAALTQSEYALTKMNELLAAVGDVLKATVPSSGLTQTSLDTKKTTIETSRSTVTKQYGYIIGQKQEIVDAKNSYTTYSIAYNKAQNGLNTAKATGDNNIAIKEAAYNQALANLQGKTVSPRSVDLAPYRAALAQAAANRNKGIIRAPIDGVVARVNKKVGELVTSADVMVNLLSPHYEIKVDVPETDVSKLKLADSAAITLDAFGDDVKFSGEVINIEPGSTEIQDVVYYKVTVRLLESDKPIKPGMTANIVVSTASRSGALYIPARAVRTEDGVKLVKILEGGKEVDATVTIGLKADEGKVEILSGLNEGQEVILGVKK